MAQRPDLPDFARTTVNLASAGLGARSVFVTDEFFAPLERMLLDKTPRWIEDEYDGNGKWMDGWESRRRRGGGHDFAIIRLAVPGQIEGFDIDTSFFTGNYPPKARIEACVCSLDPDESTAWTEILPVTGLGPDAHHFVPCTSPKVWSHLRLHIFPDGGIARLRVYGKPYLDRSAVGDQTIDLASALNGGRVLSFSDAHYGACNRMLAPGRGRDMGDGWETRRRRTPGNDWIVIALGARGIIESAQVDTAHYKGNYPESCSIQAADLGEAEGGLVNEAITAAKNWPLLMDSQELGPDAIHTFEPGKIIATRPVTHVRLNIFPDGGISRLRLFGKLKQ